ncbi:methyl-accepting chemotaxis protein [Motilimonas sp. 1_MG-2023]|uniref:methyl-accepting chemotaxis protein n=1 Tax=Motilimonas sp. 1_MG-2023 TaxID=3062672 RepID=UPI0026E4551D|nr:methyl-accepting chemotaxis protein [Motilimonas sp. 1_MG-2023]MDO6526322.1 methyl-accepting chemotaxis protein [Motilimonas sp. 1_MG-2023]
MSFSIKQVFLLISLLVILGMGLMTYLLWQASGQMQQFGLQQIQAKELQSDMLMLRRHEKDFLLRKNEKYIDQFNLRFEQMTQRLDWFKQSLAPDSHIQTDIHNSQALLSQYSATFQKLTAVDKRIGLDHSQGLQAALKLAENNVYQSVRYVQDTSKQADIIKLILLEQHFMASRDIDLHPELNQHIAVVKTNFSDPNSSQHQAVSAFEQVSNQLVESLIERGLDEQSGLRGELRGNIHQVEEEIAQLSDLLALQSVAALDQGRLSGISMAALLTTLIATFLIWQSIRVTKRLKCATSRMEDICNGDGDLTQKIEIEGKDEIARLAHAINSFIRTTATLVIEIKNKGNIVGSSAQDSVELSNSSSQAIEEQRNKTLAVASSVEQMMIAVEQVAAHTEQVSHSAEHADVIIRQSDEAMQQAQNRIDKLQQQITQSVDNISYLSQASQEIGQVVAVIREITEQTNLLALNAAIEAARAGESGRGFAVVADEVRTLAQRTQTSTVDIEKIITQLQQAVQQSSSSMQSGLTLVDGTVEQVNQASEYIKQTRCEFEKIKNMTAQIAVATTEQKSTVAHVSDATQSISCAAEQLLADAQRSRTSNQNLQTHAAEMQHDVARFVV